MRRLKPQLTAPTTATTDMTPENPQESGAAGAPDAAVDQPVNRRSFLRRGGLIIGGSVLAGVGGGAIWEQSQRKAAQQPKGSQQTEIGAGEAASGSQPATAGGLFGPDTVPFHGANQAGISTPPPAYAVLLAFNVDPQLGKDGARRLLRIISQDAERLTQGKPSLTDAAAEMAVNPANLTVTVGLGPQFFTYADLESVRPSWLRQLPSYRIDQLEEQWNEGDLMIQLCADDEMAIAHARRILISQVARYAQVRWVQRGFKQARGSQPEDTTMRNLMGQVDGTANLPQQTHQDLLWCGADQGLWQGGTSMVVRRISMILDTWDEVDRVAREDVMGRNLTNGAPLTGTQEHDEPDFEAVSNLGFPIIAPYSHVRRSRPDDPKQRIWRRAYNYDDHPLPGHSSNTGLVFISFQADIYAQFAPIQERLAELDALNEWTVPIGSAVFAILPGCQPGQYLGQQLLEA